MVFVVRARRGGEKGKRDRERERAGKLSNSGALFVGPTTSCVNLFRCEGFPPESISCWNSVAATFVYTYSRILICSVLYAFLLFLRDTRTRPSESTYSGEDKFKAGRKWRY